ncbi:glycosyl transferase [Bacillus tianshenii]|uniref:glycosyltransferase n=1 Tax=Sutcliffiella tianshenii TaxID=1463404 RepID=UPI001CD74C24|nr:glycosyltransferase [Bacillus tianshenii]MCA1322112.1 glycosyl transferase [Bacillus tianshenii]
MKEKISSSNGNLLNVFSDWGYLKKRRVVGEVGNNEGLHHICITASKDYVIKVLAMYDSLIRNSSSFKLWVCCMDNQAFETLKKLNHEHMVLFFVEQMEDQTLSELRKQRKVNEYCWTLKAPLCHHLLTTYNLESILYCDGDIYFFSDPKEIFDEWGSASIYLCPQRDAEWVEKKYGKYQAGLIGFRNDQIGLESLNWWRKRCEEWCFATPDENRFGDQKYLDKFPQIYSNVKISKHLGINAAPWNTVYNNNYSIQESNGEVYIENDRLVAYHFACLSIFNDTEFDLWSLDKLKLSRAIKKFIYEPYIIKIGELINGLKNSGVNAEAFFTTRNKSEARSFYKYTELRKTMDESDDFYCFSTIISKEYLIKGLALYHSLKKHTEAFHLWICCMDSQTLTALQKLKLENVTLIPVEQIENNLVGSFKNGRSLTESCWSMKAPLCSYVLENYSEVDHIVYCDADMYFFASPKPIFDVWSTYSIFLTKQRSTPQIESDHGIYQAGLIGFKREPNSMKILNWWKEKCIDWCYDSPYDSTRWGDQKYLTQIPNLFSNIKIINHLGIDAAPWNVVMKDDHPVYKYKGTVYVDNDELVCYHFGSMLIINPNKYELWKLERLAFPKKIITHVYSPYLRQLQTIHNELKNQGIIQNSSDFLSTIPSNYSPKNIYTI